MVNGKISYRYRVQAINLLMITEFHFYRFGTHGQNYAEMFIVQQMMLSTDVRVTKTMSQSRMKFNTETSDLLLCNLGQKLLMCHFQAKMWQLT